MRCGRKLFTLKGSKWRANKVELTVSSGKVSDIKELITAAKFDKTQVIYDEIKNKRSLQVDAVSWATLTSKAILKAVENAVIKAEK